MLAGSRTSTRAPSRSAVRTSRVSSEEAGHRDGLRVYALYAHVGRAEHGFSLKLRGASTEDVGGGWRRRRPAELTYLDRKRARVRRSDSGWRWVGRSSRAAVFLMDEPLSNLDAKLRVETGRTSRPAASARHDDALRHPRPGRGHDDGPPGRGALGRPAAAVRHARTLYERPANTYVAGFIGSPAMNLVPASRTGRRWTSAASRCRCPRPRRRRSSSGCARRCSCPMAR